MMGTGLGSQAPNMSPSGSTLGSTHKWPYAFFPAENPYILDDSWRFNIIYDPQTQAVANTPFLLTLNKNDDQCITDRIINDDEIMAAATPALGRHQRDTQDGSRRGNANSVSFDDSLGHSSSRGTLTGDLTRADKSAERAGRTLGKVRKNCFI